MKRTKHVALLIETSREYGRGLLRGVTSYHREQADWSIYFKPQGLGAPPPPWLAGWKGDGILARIDDRRMARAVQATGLPAVDLRGALDDLGLPAIGVDNREVAKLGVRHLRDCGLRHFAFCGVPPGTNRHDDQRCDYFREEVETFGYECSVFANWRNWDIWERGQQAIGAWLAALPKPVGVMTCHDERGQQVLDACRRVALGVPDEVAVISVDNDSYLCNLTIPPMTSVDVNPERNGYQAARLLDQLMRGRRPRSRSIYLPPRCVVTRQSTDTVAVVDPEVAAVVRFIRDHACTGIRIDQALARATISRSTVTRRFKQLLKRTPMAELTRVRLQHAQNLLLDTDLPMSAIASRCGFQEAKYFIEAFHRQVGETPGRFRKLAMAAQRPAP
jgi:LacI family transcriptional regulator